LQKNQIGVEAFVIVRFQIGNPLVVFAGMETYPESKPSATGLQGLLKEVWVTLWFPGEPVKLKVITEPTVALILFGVNLIPPKPT